jgi:hypothetical protein
MELTARTKTVEVDGTKYELRRMTPIMGSYFWQRLMHACYVAAQARAVQQETDTAPEDAPKPLAEDRLRGLCAMAYMHMDMEDFERVQTACMKLISRLELNAGAETFMPVMTDTGRWVAADLFDKPLTVTKLTTEALVFNLIGFLV